MGGRLIKREARGAMKGFINQMTKEGYAEALKKTMEEIGKQEEFFEELSTKQFSLDIAKRFVSDYNLPIPLHNKTWEGFRYYLNLYNKEFDTINKWNKLMFRIFKHHDGDSSAFLKDFYDRRESIVQFFHNNPAQKEFTSMDMNQFAVPDRPQVSKNNVYNGDGDGQIFISIDLRKANFQAMKYVNPALVDNAETYEEFVGKFAPGMEYFTDSKYLRQVVFGQSCPKRQVTVETYLTNEVWKLWKEWAKPEFDNIVSFTNDEFVIKLRDPKNIRRTQILKYLDEFVKLVKEKLGLEIKAECFGLRQVQLCTETPGKTVVTFFVKVNFDGTTKLMCLPLNYRAIVTKLLNGLPIEEPDLHFPYEGYDCKFCETFYLKVKDD